MKYYFVEPLTEELTEQLDAYYPHHSSDLLENPEGYILTEEDIKDLNPSDYRLWNIPDQYQDDIDSFIEDFWDGDVVIKELRG